MTASFPYALDARFDASLGVTHHLAHANGVRIHYVRAGEGEPVILLHGWPQTWYMWRKVIPLLGGQYTLIAPDLRGFGESSRPLAGYDKRSVAEDIWHLGESLGLGGAHLVGHDLGGATAYAYASAHRRAVKSLVVLDVPITIDKATAQAYRSRFFHLSFHCQPDIALSLVSGRERAYLTHFYRNCYNPAAFSAADIEEYVAAFSAPGAMRASMAHYAAHAIDLEHNAENARTLLEMPVLGLGGEFSFRDAVRDSLRRVAKNVRGGTLPGCAHWIAEEQPQALSRQLLAFFTDCQRNFNHCNGGGHHDQENIH